MSGQEEQANPGKAPAEVEVQVQEDLDLDQQNQSHGKSAQQAAMNLKGTEAKGKATQKVAKDADGADAVKSKLKNPISRAPVEPESEQAVKVKSANGGHKSKSKQGSAMRSKLSHKSRSTYTMSSSAHRMVSMRLLELEKCVKQNEVDSDILKEKQVLARKRGEFDRARSELDRQEESLEQERLRRRDLAEYDVLRKIYEEEEDEEEKDRSCITGLDEEETTARTKHWVEETDQDQGQGGRQDAQEFDYQENQECTQPSIVRHNQTFIPRWEQTQEAGVRYPPAMYQDQEMGGNDPRTTQHPGPGNGEVLVTSIAQALTSCINRQDAPDCDLEAFSGDPLNFHLFIKQFEDLVESKITDESGRLNRLIKFTDGTAKELVKSYLYEPKEVAYQNAKAMLEKEYGNSYIIASAYAREIRDYTVIKIDNGPALKKFHLFIQKLKICSERNVDIQRELNTQENIRNLSLKLPYKSQERWKRNATSIWMHTNTVPSLHQFANFAKNESDVANNPVYGGTTPDNSGFRKPPFRNFDKRDSDRKFKSTATGLKSEKYCAYCETNTHDIDDCYRFKKLDLSARKDFVASKHLCYGCYDRCNRDHYSRNCTKRRKCATCHGNHPTLLHEDRPRRNPYHEDKWKKTEKPQASSQQTSNPMTTEKEKSESQDKRETKSEGGTGKAASTNMNGEKIAMNCVMVLVQSDKNPEKFVKTYAFLDSLANSSFMSEELRLELEGVDPSQKTEKFTVVTMTGETEILSTPVSGLSVYNSDKNSKLKLPKVFCRPELPLDSDDIMGHDELKKWPHLAHLVHEIPDRDTELNVGLILGNNVPRALEPHQYVRGYNGSPYAVKTRFGWSACGPMIGQKCDKVKMNFTSVKSVATSGRSVIVEDKTERDQELNTLVRDFFARDFVDIDTGSKELSTEDVQFLALMEKETRLVDGQYHLPLPIRNPGKVMPDNREQAKQLALSIRKRLGNNPKMAEEYKNFMNSIISKDYAEKVPADELERPTGQVWYLPHHGVYHPSKGSIRIVFNASKEYEGVSLNSELLQGPTLTNDLVGVLLRFRTGEFAFTADLEKMFYQVRVPAEQRNLVRFFWWTDSDLNGDPTEYRMNVHLFGAVSSPSCASYALQLCAKENASYVSSEAVNTILNDFYVDDVLKSTDSKFGAMNLIGELRALCKMGGFNLTKFSASDETLLENLDTKFCVVSNGDPTMVLGMKWYKDEDVLKFREPNEKRERNLSRRTMLAALHSIYDPLGLFAPFLLKGKIVLQNLSSCEERLSWDDPVPAEEVRVWLEWKQDIVSLKTLEINRCYKPKSFGKLKRVGLHVFSDASNIGYGCVIYVKLENTDGDISVALVQGKSRVIPARGETTPRAELVAATLAAELGSQAKIQLSSVYEDIEMYYHTDSTVVLGYIMNETKRFKLFVSNRVRRIRSYTNPSDWRHCSSEDNPADAASRGLKASNITVDHMWFTGPKFLLDSSDECSAEALNVSVSEDDPELRKCRKATATNLKPDTTKLDLETEPVLKMISNMSSWSAMVRRIATVIAILENRGQKPEVKLEHLELAKVKILSRYQKHSFKDEYCQLQKGNELNQSVIANLNPFLDSSGLIRVGGRVDAANLDYNIKHPIILPKFGIITDSIIRHFHEKVKHCGRTTTTNEIRGNGFWILHMSSRVKCLIHKCVTCRMLRGKFNEQKMAPLPKDRLQYEAPPMSYCGVDVFGHFIVKNARKEQKRYCALFTDLVYRGVHIEVMDNLDTDSFLCALRRFTARRGNLRLLRSDNGSNFHGANNELKKALQEMEPSVREFLVDNGGEVEWKFNTPTASHHGGAWERKIGCARRVMEAVLKRHSGLLNDQSFRTLMTEVEAVVNCQPLTVDGLNDPQGPIPLSPMNILTQKTKIILPPPGNFDDDAELYTRKQWRRVQYLANAIWSRYCKEYLKQLQTRSKWNKTQRNFQIGDIVVSKDDSQHRNHWPLGRVTELFPDSSGNVRSVKIRMARSDFKDTVKYFQRPISKLVLLLETEIQDISDK